NDFSKIKKELNEIDQVVKQLVTYFETVNSEIILLSEYGINPVHQPIHINRFLREKGYIAIREERGLELLDAGASEAFSSSDHQIAHIYIKDKEKIAQIKDELNDIKGIKLILDKKEQEAYHLQHKRSGDLVLIANDESWFTYYYWLDDSKAPDFARLVDIHKKPGYDPVEMFMDPSNPFIKLKAAYKLARKLSGFRYLMNVIPLDANLIKGSHGSPFVDKKYYPLFISSNNKQNELEPNEVFDEILDTIF
ncbi:MAG: hypothetical protein RJA76_197, partial [Bacteroidota bacterium]